MVRSSETHAVLAAHLRDPSSGFSVGSFGAIAEFHRDPDEAYDFDAEDGLAVVTERGALRVRSSAAVEPVAYELLSANPQRWQHGVVFCLPEAEAIGSGREILTELGPDGAAIRERDRGGILFDMGLGARNVDFCIRTADAALLSVLRRTAGRSVFEAGNPAMGAIIAADPHRVVTSKIARAEVYQPIGRAVTPEGPHTHVLPDLLKSGRTHAAGIPVPDGYLPGLSLHPANPLIDALGRETPFDRAHLEAFARLLDRWGAPAYRAEKARVSAALDRGCAPERFQPTNARSARAALRIALRQRRQIVGGGALIEDWRRAFEPRAIQDETVDHGH